MARRRVLLINRVRKVKNPSSHYSDEIRVEIRVIFPPQAQEHEISQTLYHAHIHAQASMREALDRGQ